MNPSEPQYQPQQSTPPTPTPQPQPVYTPQTPQPNQYGNYDVTPPPQQPVSSPGNGGHNPYEFIFATPQVEKKRFLAGASLLKRILIIVGFLAVLTIIAAIAVSLLAPKDTASSHLLPLAQEQQEIIRIAQAGSAVAKTDEARNLALNTQLSLGSNQTAMVKYLTDHGTKVDVILLDTKKDAATDKLLATAITTNTYDRALTQTLHTQLVAYRTNLNAAYQQVSGKNARALLSDSYKAAELLIAQANKITPTE